MNNFFNDVLMLVLVHHERTQHVDNTQFDHLVLSAYDLLLKFSPIIWLPLSDIGNCFRILLLDDLTEDLQSQHSQLNVVLIAFGEINHVQYDLIIWDSACTREGELTQLLNIRYLLDEFIHLVTGSLLKFFPLDNHIHPLSQLLRLHGHIANTGLPDIEMDSN